MKKYLTRNMTAYHYKMVIDTKEMRSNLKPSMPIAIKQRLEQW